MNKRVHNYDNFKKLISVLFYECYTFDCSSFRSYKLVCKDSVFSRSFHRIAVRSSSVHEGKIIIFERFQCSLTKTIQLN